MLGIIISIIVVVVIFLMIGIYSTMAMASYADDKANRDDVVKDTNRCVCCGEIIPEGRQVCPNCESKKENE